ncbi:MAG: YheV family putative zinc ribbon protein [Pseudomonadota bacterium]
MFSETRRFIAGARCPRCAAQDRVVVYRRDGLDHRECVACGWIEVWGGAPTAGARAPGAPRSGGDPD